MEYSAHKKILIASVFVIFLSSNSAVRQHKKPIVNEFFKSFEGTFTQDTLDNIIRDSIAAVKIGKVILGTIYGDNYIDKCKPFYAKLLNNNDTWKVSGSMHKRFTVGGEPVIFLHKKDARVIKYYHTR